VQAAGGRWDIRYKARRAANVMTDSSSCCFDTKRGGGGGGSDTGRAVGRSKRAQSLHREVGSNRQAIDSVTTQSRRAVVLGLFALAVRVMVGGYPVAAQTRGSTWPLAARRCPRAPSSDRSARARWLCPTIRTMARCRPPWPFDL
jgi:hypothetical protein